MRDLLADIAALIAVTAFIASAANLAFLLAH